MVPFKYFFWSALFGGIIGGICGVMLTFKIYVNGNEEPEEPAEDPNEEELQAAIQEEMILNPVHQGNVQNNVCDWLEHRMQLGYVFLTVEKGSLVKTYLE
ncbi:unnamed protein product [Porites evermanni]|uniref:Uncharacterized protein n=1 Tax=Porites evermanni TaxID=104178 RepID=A0ABN8R5W4_9CNID|nr:unnamed protein product [Porites evermanni]